MREYKRIEFKNHPTISFEYVCFLVKNAIVGGVTCLEAENKLLKDKLLEVEAIAKNAMKKGETALNRADKVKNLVENK